MNPVRRKLEALFVSFLHGLSSNLVIDLRIPASILVNDEQVFKLRRLSDSRSCKKYTQLFAVAVLVLELIIKSKSISQRWYVHTRPLID